MSITASAAAALVPANVTTPVAVADTGGNVVTYLAQLQALAAANELASVSLTGTGTQTLSLTVAQLLADAQALLLINTSFIIMVSGTATAAQAAAVNATLAPKLTGGGISVSDSAANVMASITGLESLAKAGKLISIALTDSGTPNLSMTAANLVTNAAALVKITGSYTITLTGTATAAQAAAANPNLVAKLAAGFAVSDTAANVTSYLSGLQTLTTTGKLASVTLTGTGSQVLTLTAAQVVADSAALLLIGTTYKIALSGTATAAQATGFNATLLAKLSAPIVVSDTAADVLASLTGLETLATGAKLASIALTDSATPNITLTAVQLVQDAAALVRISSAFTITLSGNATAAQASAANATLVAKLTSGFVVVDTAANVLNYLATLQTRAAAGMLASITLTNTGTPSLALTIAQLDADSQALLAITGSFTIAVSSPVTAAQAAGVAPNLVSKLSAALTVSDTALNVSAYLAGLQTLAGGGKLASVTLTDSGTPVLSVTAASLVADAGALALIGGTWSLTVASGTVTAAQVVALSNTVTAHLTAGLAVSDTAAGVAAALGALQGLGGVVASIALTDGGTPALAVSAAALVADAATLLKVTSAFALTVTGTLTVAQAATAQTQGLLGLISNGAAIADTASNVQAALGTLLGYGSAVGSVALTDSGTPTISLTAANLVSDAAVLAKISGTWHLTVSSGAVTAAQAIALSSTVTAHLTAGLAVSDSATDVAADLTALTALGGTVASITLTDSATPTITVTAAALVAQAATLAKIGGVWNLTIASGTVTAAQALALSATITAHLTAGLAVADSAATISGSIDALTALGATVASIALTDSGTPALTVTATQLVSDAATLLKLSGSYAITVSGTATAAQAAAVNATLAGKLAAGLVVSDAAASVTSNLSGLQALASLGKLASVTLTDSGTPVITVTAASLIADATALALIGGSFGLTVSSGTVTVAQAIALSGTVTAHLTGGVAISDSVANVQAALGALQGLGSVVGSVALTSSPATIAVTADALWHDAAILAKIVTGGATLAADTVNTASAAAAANLASAPAYTGTLLFADTAANVATYLDSLQALATAGHLGAITLTNGGTPTLSITASQLVNDAGALALIGGGFAIAVTSGSVTAAQMAAIGSGVLAHLSGAVTVSDTSSNIVSGLDTLQARYGAIAAISFSNGTPTLSLMPATVTADINALALASGYGLSISGSLTAAQAATLSASTVAQHLLTGPAVSDSAANIAAALPALMTLANASALGAITLTDSAPVTLTVTPAQLVNDTAVLRKITTSFTFALTAPLTADQAAGISNLLISKLPSSLAVQDSAADVLSDLDGLEVLASGSHLGSITLTDTGTPVLDVTAAQLASDGAVLGKIATSFQVLLSGGITAAEAATFATQTAELAAAVSVVDTAAAVQANLAGLQVLAAASLLNAIAFTDTGTPTLALTASVFAASTNALATIAGGYAISLTGTLSVAQAQAAATANLLGHVTGGVSISDIAANVQAGIGTLTTLTSAISTIALTDSGTPTITLSAAELAADAAVLRLITSAYGLTVSSGTLTVAQATGLGQSVTAHLTGGLAVSDSASNVTAGLAALQTMGAAIGSIALTGSAPVVTVTAAQLIADAATLLKIGGVFGITVSGTATAAQATGASQGLLADLTTGLAVSDAAVNVVANLAGLTALGSSVASIALTDSGTPAISVSATMLVADAATLAKITGSWGLTVASGSVTAAQAVALSGSVTSHLTAGLAVVDSAADVTGALDALTAIGTTIASVAFSDSSTPSLAITAGQLVSDAAMLGKITSSYTLSITGVLTVSQAQAAQTAGVLALVTGGAAISDSAANVQAALATLQGYGASVASVSLTDSTTPTITLSATALIADAALLAKITGTWHLAVSSGSVTVAQAAALSGTVTAHLAAGLAVSDSAVNIAAGLAELTSLGATVASVALTDSGTPVITVTATTLLGNAAALAKVAGSWSLVVSSGSVTAAQAIGLSAGVTAHLGAGLAVSDSAADVSANLDALTALGATVASIALSDSGTPTLTITGVQLVSDAATLGKITGSYALSLTGTLTVSQAQAAYAAGVLALVTGGAAISDSAANVQAALATLQIYGASVASVALTDSTTPTITLTAATLVADAAVLAKIAGTWNLAVSSGGVTAAQAVALGGTPTAHLGAGLAVVDSASGVMTALDGLQALGAAVASIALTDSGTPGLTVTATQLANDAATLTKITSSFGLTVSGSVSAAVAAALNAALAAKLTTGLAVSDSAAAVTTSLDGLQTQAAAGAIASITLTDASEPTLSLSATSLIADLTALGAIVSAYHLTVASGTLTVSQVATLNAAASVASHLTASVTVYDTGAHVAGGIAALLTLGSALEAIELSDSGTPDLTATAAQFVTYSSLWLKVTGNYALTLSGTASVAQATQLNATLAAKLTAGATVSDSASNVAGGLDALQALGSAVATIALTDSGTPSLAITSTQLVSDAATLLKIGTSGYAIALTGALTVAQAQTAYGQGLLALVTGGAAISDSASDVQAALTTLQGYGAKIASIALTDGATPTISVTAANLIADAATLAKIGGTWNLTVSSGTVTVAQALALSGTVTAHLTTGLAVSDTAAAVASSLDALATAGATVASIALTDTTPVLTITAARLVADAATLLKVTGTFRIALSSSATASQAASANATLAGYVQNGIPVYDSAANVTTALGGLQALAAAGDLSAITLSDSGTPTITVTAANLIADSAALTLIGSSFHLTVSSGTVTAAQATGLSNALTQVLTAGLAVSDAASNVTSNLTALTTMGSAVASIALTDSGTPTITVTAANLIADAAGLAKISGTWNLTVSSGTVTVAQALALSGTVTTHLTAGLAVSDTAAAVASNLDALATAGATVASIALTDTTPVLTITAARFVADAATLLKVTGTYHITVSGTATASQAASANATLAGYLTASLAVSDLAASVATNLAGLQTLAAAGHLASVTLTDSSTPTITVTAANLVADASALVLIGGSWHLSVSSGTVTAAQAIGLSSTLTAHLTAGLAVADTATQVSGNLAALQAMGSAVASVALTGSPATFAVTADQLWHDSTILAKIITGGAALAADTVNTASAAAAANLGSAPAYTGTLLFSDSAANVATYIDSLQALATAGHLGTITLSDSGTPTLSITATQLVNDAGALALISGSYAIAVTSGTLTATQMLAISNTVLTHLSGAVTVRDASSTIVSDLDSLQSRYGAISAISFTNGTPTLSLTGTKITSDINALSLASGYNLAVSGTFTAAQATALSGTAVVSHLLTGPAVSDSAANIVAALPSLLSLANANALGAITLTDSAPVTVTVTPAALANDVAVLRKITTSYTLTTSTALTVAQATSVNSVLVPKLSASLAVSDSATNVYGNLDALQALAVAGHLGSVSLTDSGTPVLVVTADQMTSDSAVLADIIGTFKIDITGGITAAQAQTYATNIAELADALNVYDAAASVQGAMPSLETLAAAGLLNSIAFTDSGTPNLALTASVFAASLTALNTIVGSFTVSLTGSLTVAQVEAAATAGLLGTVTAGVTINDTATHVQSGLDALEALGGAVTGITLSDGSEPTITVTAATLVSDASVLALISSAYHLTVSSGTVTVAQATALSGTVTAHLTAGVAVSDSASAVTTSLAALQSMGAALGSIALTDTTPVLSLTASQLVADATTLLKISGSYAISLTGTLLVSDAETLFSDGLLAHVTGGAAITDSAASVQAAIGTLNGFGAQLSAITLNDGATPTISVPAQTIITDAAALAKIGGTWHLAVSDSGTVTALQAVNLSNIVALHLTSGLAVSDTAAGVAAQIDALQSLATPVDSIALSNGGTPAMALTSTQLANDGATLDLINTTNTPYTITLSGTLTEQQAETAQQQSLLALVTGGVAISDQAINVQDAIDTLQGYGASVASIALTDSNPAISITATQLVNDDATLAKITTASWQLSVGGTVTATQAAALTPSVVAHISTGGLAVSGNSATDVVPNLDALQSLGGVIGSIALTDSTPVLSILSSQLFNDATALLKITGSYQIDVTDDPGAELATEFNTTLLGKLSTGLTVSDSAQNVSFELYGLQTLVTNNELAAITLTDNPGDPTISINALALTANYGALNKITSPYQLTINYGTILAATAVALPNNVTSHLTGGLSVQDSSAAVSAHIDGLHTVYTSLGGVFLNDSDPVLAITATQLVADDDVLLLVSANQGSYAIDLTGSLAVTDAEGAYNDGLLQYVSGGAAISDLAANVQDAIGTLQGYGAMIASIALSDLSTPTITLSAQTIIADAAALAKISGTWNLTASNGTTVYAIQAAELSNTVAQHLTTGLVVNDTASDVAAQIDALQGLATPVSAIVLSDGNTPAMALSSTQLANDGATLDLINTTNTPYTITLTGALTVQQAETAQTQSLLALVTGGAAISDTGLDVQGGLDTLQGYGGKVASIALHDAFTSTISITATQLVNDDTTLAKINSGSYYLIITSGTVTAAQAWALTPSVTANLSAGLSVSGNSSTDVVPNLDNLEALGSVVGTIALTDSTPVLSLLGSQLYNDATALLKITSSYQISVIDTPGAQLATEFNSTLLGKLSAGLAVSDSAQNVTTYLDGLQTLAMNSELASIALTDLSEPTITINATMLGNDYAALNLISSSYHLTISSGTLLAATAAELPVAVRQKLTNELNVSDSAAAVSASLDGLESVVTSLNSIVLNDSQTPVLTMTAQQLGSDNLALELITASAGSFGIDLTSGTLLVNDTESANSDGLLVHVTAGVTISDTANAVQGALDTLQGYGSEVAHIALTDNPTPTITLTAMQLYNDAATLMKISSSFNLAVTSGTVTAAQAASLISDGLTSHLTSTLAVTDSTADMLAHLSALQTLSSNSDLGTVTAITSPSALAVTATQAASDTAAINAVLGATGTHANPTLYISDTSSSGEAIDASQFATAANISVYGNTASMSFVGSAATVNGSADTVTLSGSAADTFDANAFGTGVETIHGFSFGLDTLNITGANVYAADVTVNGTAAVALTSGGIGGILLINPGLDAAQITTDHLFTAGGRTIIS